MAASETSAIKSEASRQDAKISDLIQVFATKRHENYCGG